MALLRLALCVAGVYSMFLLWAIAQERLSVPFKSKDGENFEKFRSALFIGTCQSAMSSLSALVYILLRRKPGESLVLSLGLVPSSLSVEDEKALVSGSARVNRNGNGLDFKAASDYRTRILARYFQCAVFITSAAPFGFAALSYISYPAMVLGKSCKLVPVMVMNVILYRRKFAPHKYLVVAMVTTGITVFMGLGKEGSAKSNGKSATPTAYSSMVGIIYLLINLLLDGAINSTQDEIFSRFKIKGQQMMFWINLMCTLLTTILSVLPLPYIPVIHPSSEGTEFAVATTFIKSHPDVLLPLAQFAFTGALGQLFIFEILQHFGSLTLVTVTLTRKLFTMLLSVMVYKHHLQPGQWVGAGIVFAGISVEAYIKRREFHAKRVLQEREKAKIKPL